MTTLDYAIINAVLDYKINATLHYKIINALED
jgi:hypothetical protein